LGRRQPSPVIFDFLDNFFKKHYYYSTVLDIHELRFEAENRIAMLHPFIKMKHYGDAI